MATLISTGLPAGFGNPQQSFLYGSIDPSPMLGLSSHYSTNLLGQPGSHLGPGASSSFELGHTGMDRLDAHTATHPRPPCASSSSDSSTYSHSSLSSLFFLPDTSAGNSPLRKRPSPAGFRARNDGIRLDNQPSKGAHSPANLRTTSAYASELELPRTSLAHREQQPLCISPKLIMGQGESEESRSGSHTTTAASSATTRPSISVQGSTPGPSPLLLSSSLLFPYTSTEAALGDSQTAYNTTPAHTLGQEQWMQGLSLGSVPASATSSPAGSYPGQHAPLSGSARVPCDALGAVQSRASHTASPSTQLINEQYNSTSAPLMSSNMFDIGLSTLNATVPQPNRTATYTHVPYAPYGSGIPVIPPQYSFTGGYSFEQPAHPSIGCSSPYGNFGVVPTDLHYQSVPSVPSAMPSSTSMPSLPTSSTTPSLELLRGSRRGSTGGALSHGAPSLGNRSTYRRPATTSQLPAYGSSGVNNGLGSVPPFNPAIPSQLNARSPMSTSALPSLSTLPELSATHCSSRPARSSLNGDYGRHALPMATQPDLPKSSLASTHLPVRSYGTRTRQNMQGLLHESDVDRTFPGEWGDAFR